MLWIAWRDCEMLIWSLRCVWKKKTSFGDLFNWLHRWKAVSESHPLKRQIFASFSQILRPDAIRASNTSSISITKIAAASVPEGESAAGEVGKKAAGRVVGQSITHSNSINPFFNGWRDADSRVWQDFYFFQSRPSNGTPWTPWWNRVTTSLFMISTCLLTTLITQKLVELIPAIQTSQETLDRARSFAVACGKGTHSINITRLETVSDLCDVILVMSP